MEILDFKTVDSLPLLYHPELDIIVLSDLHLGLEGSVTSEGGYVPQFQLEELIEDIETAKERTGAGKILINGDLKHEFATTRYSEQKEIKKFLDFLDKEFEEIIVVEGNHDTFLESLVRDYSTLKNYHLESDILFVHGHEKLSELDITEDYETIVLGHEHPALVLKDEIGVKEKVDCFLYGETKDGKKLIVMPAFSKISGGSKVNQVPQRDLLSPVLRDKVEVDKLKAIAVSREAGLFEFPALEKI